jgi:hypothetical protein
MSRIGLIKLDKHKHRTRRLLFSLIGFALFFWCLTSPVFANSTVNLPLDSPLYENIETLISYGLIKSTLSSTKPFTRAEVGRLLSEAIEHAKYESISASTASLLDRLAEEYKEELSEFMAPGSTPATYIKPLDEFSLRYRYLDGPYSLFNTEGINYFDGSNATATFQSRGRLWDYISFYIQPMVNYNESFNAIDGNDETKVRLHKGYLKLTLHNIELEAGRDSIWWGPGYHGALLISNNAQPFDMVKISNPRSALLPWIFRYLGPFKFNLFMAQLDKDDAAITPPSHSKLMGLRFDFKPHPLLEFGTSYLSHFGGNRPGIDSLDISDYFYIMLSNECRDFDKRDSNKEFAIDLSLTIPNVYKIVPFADAVKCYAEVGGEDDGYPPDRRAYLVGMVVFDIFRVNGLNLRAEYADLSPSRNDVRRTWYTHSLWPMRQDGKIFGHHAGTDSVDLFIELSQRFNNGFHYKLGFDKEGNGLSFAYVQEKYQYFCEAGFDIKKQSHLTIIYSYEDIDNYMNVKDSKIENHLLGVEFNYTF